MPFSIKRLTSLHRSHSLQSPARGKTDPNKSVQPDQCDTSKQQQQPPPPPPHQSSKNSKSMKQSKNKSKHKGNPESDAVCASKTSATPNNYVADMTAAAQRAKSPPPPPLPSHQSAGQRNVPPSFVICNQTPINNSPSFHQQPLYKASNTCRYNDDQDCSAQAAGSIPNSRSLDAHEIRRLAGNQSTSNQPPSYEHSQTLRNWNKTGDNQPHLLQQRQSSAVLSDSEDVVTPETVSRPATKPPSAGKRVHYAAQTFTRASSMSGHIPAGYSNVSTSSNNNNTKQISFDDSRVSSKPRSMMLQRQVSTTNPPPLPSQAKPTSSSGMSILKNASNQGSQATNGLGFSSTGTGANSAACGPFMGLPRGGEEVLINGGGHPRSRSSKTTSSGAAVASNSSRHYAKHLHTSSSIDVVLPDSYNNNSASDYNSNNNNNNLSTKSTSASANKMDDLNSFIGTPLMCQGSLYGLFVGLDSKDHQKWIFVPLRPYGEWIDSRIRYQELFHTWVAGTFWSLFIAVFNGIPVLLCLFYNNGDNMQSSTMARKSADQKASKSKTAVSAAASTLVQTFTRLGSFRRKRSSSCSIRPTEPDSTPDSISFHNNNNHDSKTSNIKIGCSHSRNSENNESHVRVAGITAANGYNNHQGLDVVALSTPASANDNFTSSVASANGSNSYTIQNELYSSNSIIKYQKPKEINYNYYEFKSEPPPEVNPEELQLNPLITKATIEHFDMENLSINADVVSNDNNNVVRGIDEMNPLRNNSNRTVNLTDQSKIKCSPVNGNQFQSCNGKNLANEPSTNQLSRNHVKSAASVATRLVFDANGDIVNSITDHHQQSVHRFGSSPDCSERKAEIDGNDCRTNKSPIIVVSSEFAFEDNDSDEIVELFKEDSAGRSEKHGDCPDGIGAPVVSHNCISRSALSNNTNYSITNNNNNIDPAKQCPVPLESKVSSRLPQSPLDSDERRIHNYSQINYQNANNDTTNFDDDDDLYSNVNIKATTESIYSNYYPSSSSTIDSSIIHNIPISQFSKRQPKTGAPTTNIYEPILPSHSNTNFQSDSYYQPLRPSASPSPALSSVTNSAQSSYSNNSQLSAPMWPFTSSSRSPLSRAASFTSRNEYYHKYGGGPKGPSSNSNMIPILKHLQNKYPQYDILSRYTKSRNNNRTNSNSQKGTSAAGADLTKKSESNNLSSNSSDSKQHRSSKSANQANTGHNSNRSASTTPLDRNFYNFQANQSSLFDDDPGIMSEIETSATGFRRGNKVRSSLPIVRTPSKSQDRSLGLVFLQFRAETKRALLPNEITSIDTVKALFVRSFPRQLSMEYLDHPSARIYIHDPSKDMFYELEDLRDVKDRSILRIYEQGVNGPQPGGGGLPMYSGGAGGGAHDVENYGYFSEPEFDSEYQSQHIHRKRFPSPIVGQSMMVSGNPVSQSQYYGTIMLPPQYRPANLGPRQPFLPNQNLPGQPPQPPARNKQYTGYSQTLPRGTHLMSPTAISAINNPFGMIGAGQQPPPKPQRSFNNPQAGLIMIQGLPPRQALNGPLPPNQAIVPQPIAYHQNRPLPDRPYSVAGHYPPDRNGPSPRISYPPGTVPNNQEFSGYLSSPEHRPSAAMLALHSGQPHPRASFSGFPSSTRPFEAEMAGNAAAPVAYNPTYGTRHPSNPPMDDESRVRMHEMERQIASLTNVVSKALGGSKPAPPPKPASLVGHRSELNANLPTDSLTQLRQIRRRARDLRSDIRSLKRLALQQTSNTKEILQETCMKMKSALMFLSASDIQLRLERLRISTERDSYNEDASRLDKDLLELEAKVEELRSNVINRRCRVNMSNVESMALILSRASKTVADLKARYPSMAQILKKIMAQELQQIEKEEKFLKEEPDRLEHSLKRCKKLTGTLVTLKRLASVQEQRSSTNPNTSSPSQLFDKKDGSGDETSSPGNNGPSSGRDTYMSRAKRMQAWRRSANFRQNITNHNYKIDLYRGFASMPTIQEPNNVDESVAGEMIDDDAKQGPLHSAHSKPFTKDQTFPAKSYDADLMAPPHTIIQVTPATPSSTDSSSKHSSNVLENLLDELQTFSKQSSIDSPSSSTGTVMQRSSGSLRGSSSKSSNVPFDNPNSDTIARKARSKSYSSLRANSEPPGTRARGASIPDGTIDLENIALLASTCGNVAANTAALVEKRFAQSRQELLEQRHQELLRKQRQLQEQYTRLQLLSRGQIPRGFLNDLKKTGSESNIASKINSSVGSGVISSGGRGVPMSSTVHGSLRNLANQGSGLQQQSQHQSPQSTNTLPNSAKICDGPKRTTDRPQANGNVRTGESVTKKIFETDIL